MANRQTPHQTQRAREASMNRTHEEKAEASRKAAAHRDPNELQESLRKAREASMSRSHEEKSEASRKAAAHRMGRYTEEELEEG